MLLLGLGPSKKLELSKEDKGQVIAWLHRGYQRSDAPPIIGHLKGPGLPPKAKARVAVMIRVVEVVVVESARCKQRPQIMLA